MNRPDSETIALLKIALRNLTAVSHPSAERTYAVEVLKEVGSSVPDLLSPTGRKPSQPEIQHLPGWKPQGDATPRPHGFYNKDRQPIDVYTATAEQIIAQSRSYQDAAIKDTQERHIGKLPALVAPYGTVTPGTDRSLDHLPLDVVMQREWVLREGDLLVGFVPGDSESPAGAALVVSKIDTPCVGALTVVESWNGCEAHIRGIEYVRCARANKDKPQ